MPRIIVPIGFICPLSKKYMSDPVSIQGHTFDRKNIEAWFEDNDTIPFTKVEVSDKSLIPCPELKAKIQEFLAESNVCSLEYFLDLVADADIDTIEKTRYLSCYFSSRNLAGFTALHIAVKSKSTDMVKYILENGGDINIKDAFGRTPLHYAASLNLSDTVNLLLEEGADLDIIDNDGHTPLRLANIRGNRNIVKMLLRASDSDVEIKPKLRLGEE